MDIIIAAALFTAIGYYLGSKTQPVQQTVLKETQPVRRLVTDVDGDFQLTEFALLSGTDGRQLTHIIDVPSNAIGRATGVAKRMGIFYLTNKPREWRPGDDSIGVYVSEDVQTGDPLVNANLTEFMERVRDSVA